MIPQETFKYSLRKVRMGGATWQTKRLTHNSSGSASPAIAINSNNHVYLAWLDWAPGNSEIYFKKSTDGGGTWTTKRLTWTSSFSILPTITVDSNNHIHIAWCDYTPGNYEIYCKKSTDEGASWKTKRLTWTSGSSGYPAITVDASNTIHVVYGDYAIGYHELYCKRSTDGGISWTTKRLTWNVGGSYFPSVAVDPNNRIHVTWTDSTPGKNEIYYMRSTNGGMSWKTKRLTQTSGYSWNPDIAVDSNNNIHVIWYDDSSGNNEIYYKKGIQ